MPKFRCTLSLKSVTVLFLLGLILKFYLFMIFSKTSFTYWKRWAETDGASGSILYLDHTIGTSDSPLSLLQLPTESSKVENKSYGATHPNNFQEAMRTNSDISIWTKSMKMHWSHVNISSDSTEAGNLKFAKNHHVDGNATEILPMSNSSQPLSPLDEYYNKTKEGRASEILNGPELGPKEFGYLINPGNRICGDEDVFLFAFILTSLENLGRRQAIRATWGQTEDYKLPVRRLFFVGRSAAENGTLLQKVLDSESILFGDIVQEDFVDSYLNLTYKSLSGFRWAVKYCSQADYVLKIDDDTFVNMFSLLDHLRLNSPAPHPSNSSHDKKINETKGASIYCFVAPHSPVNRGGKWGVNKSQFSYAHFPMYCGGPAYVTTMTLAMSIVNASVYVPFFHMEDTYIIGFVTLLLGKNVQFFDMQRHYCFPNGFPVVFLRRGIGHYHFALHVHNIRPFKETWDVVRMHYFKMTDPMTTGVEIRMTPPPRTTQTAVTTGESELRETFTNLSISSSLLDIPS